MLNAFEAAFEEFVGELSGGVLSPWVATKFGAVTAKKKKRKEKHSEK